MLNADEEISMIRRLMLILKEYHLLLSETDLDEIAKGVFDYKGFEEKFPLKSNRKRPSPKREI